jgi:hypothetical protein
VIYFLNRRAETALAAYLASKVPGTVKVYRSTDLTSRQYPCAIARVHTASRYKGETYAAQILTGSVMVMVEFAREIDGGAAVVREFEEVQEAVVSAVMEALNLDTGELATALNATGTKGITFSHAAIGDDSGLMSISGEEGMVSTTEIPLRFIAGPKEL